jgi:DnaJ-class molecular chaperone
MADDPYVLLAVPRTASADEIQKAFRKLAKELHPDLNPNDAAAAERFKKVSAAYELLSDSDKRARFDRGEIDGAGEPRRGYNPFGAGAGGPFPRGGRPAGGPGAGPGGGPADDMGFGDIFSDLFGRGGRPRPSGPPRGQDVRYTLEVEFLEAVAGAKKRVSLPEGGVLDLAVPEGVEDGQTLRLKGKGRPGPRGAEAGDALVEVKIRPHKEFRREGNDILLELPVSIDEAVLGTRIEVATATGRVALTVPKGTSSGTVFRLRGKGVRSMTTGATGDQLVTVKIVLPPVIDEQLSYFMSEWRQKHGYDPRKG